MRIFRLDAHGQLITAYANAGAPSLELLHPGRDPLVFSDLMCKIHRTDVGRDTIDQLTVITEQLCCEYACRPPTSYATMHTTSSTTSNACSKGPPG